MPQNFARRHFLNLRIFLIKASSFILGNIWWRSPHTLQNLRVEIKFSMNNNLINRTFRQQMVPFFYKENNAICCPTAILQTYASKLLPTINFKISILCIKTINAGIVSRCHRLNCTRNRKKRHNSLKL